MSAMDGNGFCLYTNSYVVHIVSARNHAIAVHRMNINAFPWLPVCLNLNTIITANSTKTAVITTYIKSVIIFTVSLPNEVAINTVSPIPTSTDSKGICKLLFFFNARNNLTSNCFNQCFYVIVMYVFGKFVYNCLWDYNMWSSKKRL